MSSFFRTAKSLSLTLIAGLLLLFAAGCGESADATVDKIRVVDGAEQCTLPGQPYARPVKLELLGPQKPGMLGGQGNRAPAAGAVVFFEPADGSDLKVEPATATTDEGGGVTVNVTAGKTTGDQYLRVIPKDYPGKSITLRFITGMRIDGDERQYRTGSVTVEPLSVKLVKPDGSPATGIPVNFDLLSTSEGASTSAKILTPIAVTNADGVAETDVQLGDKTGIYNIGISVLNPEEGFLIQNKTVKLLGFNVLSVVIAVLGGLALFIFGMELMGDGIQKIAGEIMKKVLQFFARNGIVAVLAGKLVTAVIQSSSATTVMVIGFINAGLLNLTQAIGIIFGANIGTTVTAQIISFNLSGLALPAITIGFVITLSKRRSAKGWGESILGFGLLFFGMTMMSDELKLLADFPGFREAFRWFDCAPAAIGGWMPIGAVLGAILIGLVATMLIQSSSAAMGIVLALAAGGLINFWTAVPLLAWGLPWLFVRRRRRSATLFSSIAGKSFFWLMVMGELFAVSSMQRNPDIIINLMMVPLGCAMFMLTGLLRMRSLLTMGFWSVLLAVWRFFTLDERFFSGMGFHSSLFYLAFFAVCAATGYGIDSSCNDKENSLCSDR